MFIFRDIKKNNEGVRAIRAMKYKKYVAETYTRACAPLARKYTDRIFESKGGTTGMKIVIYIERHNFFCVTHVVLMLTSIFQEQFLKKTKEVLYLNKVNLSLTFT